jgi:asparagine synthase (glutamine-hydrolysing)
MCGICGFVGLADDDLVRAMTDTLAHRGPDGQGVRSFRSDDGRGEASLGHRRLSIIDPTPRGAQPMSYADGRYWITFNGEIYNYRELRRELAAEGFRFNSECDTEVLLAMFARHGDAMLRRLNGIFAFAIWDERERELFMARDRLGVKPLYYTRQGDALYFASEVKALLAAGTSASLRRDAVADYLTFLWVPDPDTMFEDVYKLPPGHAARFSRGNLSTWQWWDLTFGPQIASERECIDAVRETVGEAVRRQMVSDVPLGSFLSGGVDSSAVVANMTQVHEKVTTYTVGFSAEDLEHEIVPDDVPYSRVVAERFGVDYHERMLKADVVDLLPKLIWHMDEPVADPAAIANYLVCAAAREKLTVVLSGVGGDEVFAGYPRYLAARIGRALDAVPRPVRAGLKSVAADRLTLGRPGRLRGPRRNLMKFLRGIDMPAIERYLIYSSYFTSDELDAVLSPELAGSLRGHDPFRHHREYLSRVSDEHWLNQLLYLDAKTFLPCLNLTYTDKMSMAASTEVRVPLLDDEVVELAARVPARYKLHGLTRKWVFKKSMEGTLPDDVIWRRKAGFGAPVRSWLVGDLKPMVDDVLSPSAVAARGLFDPDEVQRLIRANDAGTEDNALRLWALLTLELWQQEFIDRPRSGPPAVAAAPVSR